MAEHTGMTQNAVWRIWNAFGLQPHRQESFKLSTDPFFIDKIRDVVGLYLDPPERAVALCVDEKSQIQALNRTQPVLPMMPCTPQRATHDYVRAGVTSLFAALDTATGQVITSVHRRHRAIEFKKFLAKIDREVPADLQVHLILDNYATHGRGPAVAGPPSPVPPALHPDQFLLAEPGRALARRDHQPADPLWDPPQCPGVEGHPGLDRGVERGSPAVCVDQDRRGDPRQHRLLLPTHHPTK
jgi:hypothetical protein